MAAFTAKFDAFIEKGRKRVLEERNEFRARLGELNGMSDLCTIRRKTGAVTNTHVKPTEEQKSSATQIATLQSSLSTQAQILSRESSEKSDIQHQIAQLESHHSTQLSARDRLRTAIGNARRQIDGKVQAQRDYGEKYDQQASLNGPELNFWEHYLGCRIEGSGEENKVKITFVFQAPKGSAGGAGVGGVAGSMEREAVFDLQIPEASAGAWEVSYTKPRLESNRVRAVVDKMNETKDIATLLKGMRGLFADEMR